MKAKILRVMRSPKVPATGVATLSGFTRHLRAKNTTLPITNPVQIKHFLNQSCTKNTLPISNPVQTIHYQYPILKKQNTSNNQSCTNNTLPVTNTKQTKF